MREAQTSTGDPTAAADNDRPDVEQTPEERAVAARLEAELDAFVASLGLPSVEEQIAQAGAMAASVGNRMAVHSGMRYLAVTDESTRRRLSACAAAIALKAADQAARHGVNVCPCNECRSKRHKTAGWRRRLALRLRRFVARLRRALSDD